MTEAVEMSVYCLAARYQTVVIASCLPNSVVLVSQVFLHEKACETHNGKSFLNVHHFPPAAMPRCKISSK